jgi:hypothetical protein
VPIDAPIDVVWRVLTDVHAYPEWNPFVVRVDGPVDRVGSRFRLHVRWQDGGATTAGEELVTLDPPAEAGGMRRATLAWRFTEALSALRLVRAMRTQTLEQAPGGPCVYHSHEAFHGMFAPFVPLTRVRAGMDAMARALKVRVEALAAPQGEPAPAPRARA